MLRIYTFMQKVTINKKCNINLNINIYNYNITRIIYKNLCFVDTANFKLQKHLSIM